MTKLHPQILKHEGKPSFVVLPYQEFMALREELDDLRDSRAIKDAAKADMGKARLSMEDMRANLRARQPKPDAA